MHLRGSSLTGRNALVHLEFIASVDWPAACTLFTSPKCPGVYVWMCVSVDLCPLHCIFLHRGLDSNSPRWMSSVGCRRLGAIFPRNTSNLCTFFFFFARLSLSNKTPNPCFFSHASPDLNAVHSLNHICGVWTLQTTPRVLVQGWISVVIQ